MKRANVVWAFIAILFCCFAVDTSDAQDCRGSRVRGVIRAPFAIAGRSRVVVKNILGRTINGTRNAIRVRSWGCNGGQAATSYGCTGSVSSTVFFGPASCSVPAVQSNCPGGVCPVPAVQSNCPGGVCPVPNQSQWTWPGGTPVSLSQHLQSNPHEHSPAELSGLSFQQMQDLHSAEHDLHRHITGAGPRYVPGYSEPFQGRIALNTPKQVDSDWF